MTEDFYDLLDVSSDATQKEIKKAFRTQVRIYHPDLNDDDRAQAQFTALKKAYDILGDPVERQAYDRLGHQDYVAKRTKGLPSPDLWKSTDDSSQDDQTTESGDAVDEETTTGSTTTSTTSRSTASAAGVNRSAAGAAGSTDGGTTVSQNRGTRTRSNAYTGYTEQTAISAFVRWWHDRNFAWPLIWLAALTYVAGLGHYAVANEGGLRGLSSELGAAGTDTTALWETFSSGRHGLETAVTFVSSTELVTPPLPRVQWYGVLVGLVGLSVLAVVGARVAWRRDTWGPISIDETIVVALALGVSSGLVGGPLLAGALLLPVLFGVIVYRTRQLPGWSPSVLFVLAVCAPLLALVAGVAGYASLPGDLIAYVVVPLAGAFGLPLRASIRKRFGR